jgi:hypothetical protein
MEKEFVMSTVYELLDEEDQAFSDFMNVYQAMYFTQDFTSWDDSLFYQTEELELEVV